MPANMRKHFSTFFFCFIVISLSAKSQNSPSSTFFQMINVSAYKGAPFTLTCMMYAERIDSFSGTALMALGVAKGRQVSQALGKLPMEDFKPGTWNKLILSGNLDPHADTLAIGSLYYGKARFSFDGMKLIINGKEVLVKNGDFEDAGLSAWQFANTRQNVKITVNNQSANSGKQGLSIDTWDMITVGYGNNSKTGHYANINGNRIYYEMYGEGTPLLLLHGALQSIKDFKDQIPDLAKSFKVIAVDTRGHGRSTADTTRLTYELYADDMYKLLNELHLDSVNVLGWSDGGNTGLILAMQHPEKVKKLAVMGAVLFNNETSVYSWISDTIRSQIKDFKQNSQIPGIGFKIRVKQCLLDEPNINPLSLKSIQCPVLVMAGQHDLILPSHTKLIAHSIPTSELKIFRKASHEAPQEIPDLFNKTVRGFFLR